MTPETTPHTDTHIARRYSASSLDQKVHNKLALQEELGWTPEPKRPMVCLPLGMSDQLGGKLLTAVLPGLFTTGVEFVVRGKGSASYGELFTRLSKTHEHRLHILPDDDASLRRMLAASDIALLPAIPPKNAPELRMCLQYGVIPVAPEGTASLTNYDPVQESGNAFLFPESDDLATATWRCFASLVRAAETFKFPFDWRTIQRHAMESVKK